MLPSFLPSQSVFELLKSLNLSRAELNFLKNSFRTRIKSVDGVDEIQFRFRENLCKAELIELDSLVGKIEDFLDQKYSGKVILSYKLSECCGSDCFGCQIYKNLT